MLHQTPQMQPVQATKETAYTKLSPGCCDPIVLPAPIFPPILLCSHKCNHSVSQFRELIPPKNMITGGI